MALSFQITRGLDLPIAGVPDAEIVPGPEIRRVAVVGADYLGMKPTMAVQEGDRVKLGQLLFTDKRNEGVRFTSPGAGTVVGVNRGAKRRFLSLVVELDGSGDEEAFQDFAGRDLTSLTRDEVKGNLVQSGLWTALRARPYNKTPAIDSSPYAVFVTAMDTNPLAVAPGLVIREDQQAFTHGLQVLQHLTDGKVYVCQAAGVSLPTVEGPKFEVAEFSGPHPAGLPGTHMHFIAPASQSRVNWFVGYQDVIAIGKLFATGKLSVDRVVAIGGPVLTNPKIVRTRLGANLDELTAGNINTSDPVRVVSGSVLSGRISVDPENFLSRYSNQVSVLAEGVKREFLGWQGPGFDKFSVTRVFASAWAAAGRRFAFTTSTGGSERAMVPIGTYERVMPLDILPTHFLRALITGDTEQAQKLGILELDEDDVALCTFVCPGKYEYGPLLRKSLETIEVEG